jgi:hypothetical protein
MANHHVYHGLEAYKETQLATVNLCTVLTSIDPNSPMNAESKEFEIAVIGFYQNLLRWFSGVSGGLMK